MAWNAPVPCPNDSSDCCLATSKRTTGTAEKINNIPGGGRDCEAIHFEFFDLTFRMLQHTFSKVSVIFLKNYINTIEITRDL